MKEDQGESEVGREGTHNGWEQLCVQKPSIKPPAIYCLNT